MAAAVDIQSGEIHYEYYINSLMVCYSIIVDSIDRFIEDRFEVFFFLLNWISTKSKFNFFRWTYDDLVKFVITLLVLNKIEGKQIEFLKTSIIIIMIEWDK